MSLRRFSPAVLATCLLNLGITAPGEDEPDPFGGSSPVLPRVGPVDPNIEPDPFSPRPPKMAPEPKPAPVEEAMVMNNRRLGVLIESIDPNPKGQPGFWQFDLEGTAMLCITDERADRMRIMTPIAGIEDVSARQLAECMKANFDRALDARYCVDDGVLYGAFIHPLQDLTPRLFLSAVEQVYTVRATFGTTYTSSGLIFGGDDDDEEEDSGEKRPDPKGSRA